MYLFEPLHCSISNGHNESITLHVCVFGLRVHKYNVASQTLQNWLQLSSGKHGYEQFRSCGSLRGTLNSSIMSPSSFTSLFASHPGGQQGVPSLSLGHPSWGTTTDCCPSFRMSLHAHRQFSSQSEVCSNKSMDMATRVWYVSDQLSVVNCCTAHCITICYVAAQHTTTSFGLKQV